jgi:preprotein translocase subunit SecF
MKFNFNIIGLRRRFYIVSAVFIILGLGLLGVRGLNLGIDFRSGTILELEVTPTVFELDLRQSFKTEDVNKVLAPFYPAVYFGEVEENATSVEVSVMGFDQADFSQVLTKVRAEWPQATATTPVIEKVSTAEVRELLGQFYERIQIREAGTQGTAVEVRTTDFNDEQFAQVMSAVREVWPMTYASIPVSVDATFSGELVRNALVALLLASIGMLIYIGIRFEFKFAVSAVLALLHDVLVVLAFFSLFRIEINSEFVAAILTIVGYSINDTIVVFDRIRENLRLSKRQSDFEGLVNRSIMETLLRSINTSVTTLLAIGAVLFLGGVTLRPMALALVVGILAGTYSSIFIASSVWVDWKEYEYAKRVKSA